MRLPELTYKKLSAFFIPLGVSASLTSITHVIINGTLSRGENAAFIIACYAVAMGVFGIVERPMLVFRQVTSALVKNHRDFKLVSIFFIYVIVVALAGCTILGYTPVGSWIYINIFNATPDMVNEINIAFRVITWVVFFSGLRGIYQGILINQLATNWVSYGVIARLIGMFLAAYIFVQIGWITGATGSLIFLIGMFIEAVFSVYKAETILRKKLAVPNPEDRPLQKAEISRFYFPLLSYFVMQSLLVPLIYVFLAKSEHIEMSIASFALAFSIVNLILSFFMYTHQLVLQFYNDHRRKIIIFVIFISIIPTLLLVILCYTPVGMGFMTNVMGADEVLSRETLLVLQFFIIKTLVFPWVDFLNGFLMLKRQTGKMLFAQIGNLIVVMICLFIFIRLFPQWNGVNGAISASIGEMAGFIIVSYIIYRMTDRYFERKRQRLNAKAKRR